MNYYRKPYHKLSIAQIVKICFAWTFIFLIGYTYVAHDLFHGLNHFMHHDHSQICTEETEKDVCHLALVHHESDACKHPFHFSNTEYDCESCDFSISPINEYKIAEDDAKFYHHFLNGVYYYRSPTTEQVQFSFLSRGPPSSII